MDLLVSTLLGLVQGLTEFLPISSSGHVILIRDFWAVSEAYALATESVLLLFGTLAIITYFRLDLWILVQALIRKLGRLPANEKDLTLLYALIVGTIPGVILGLSLESWLSEFKSASVVAGVWFCSAIFMMYAEWRYYLQPPRSSLTIHRGLLIGLFQALALLPGFSRLGATVAGGMLLGLSRIEAARFSFLLGIPVTLGVGSKKLLELLALNEAIDWLPVMVGGVVCYFFALITIHFFLGLLRRYTLWPFVWYSIIVSGMVAYFAIFL